jgi:isochorismate hydrolase
MADLTFGPPGREWTYFPLTKTYDLSPATPLASKLTISTTAGAPDTSFTFDSSKTALVIVDMQNFFLDPKSMEHPAGVAAVEPTIKLIAKCRSLGIQVFPPMSPVSVFV